MANLIWTPQAQRDVQRLHGFLAPKSPLSAQQAVAAIREGVQRLRRFPQAGRPVSELGHDRRELLVAHGDSGYAILYFFAGGDVEVLAIRHQREAGY